MTASGRARGFSSALMLVVLALLGSLLAYAVTVTRTQHTDLAQAMAADRALQAARGGLEWARYRITTGPAPLCAASTTLAWPTTSGPLPVTVRCTESLPAFNEGGTAVRVFQLAATACGPTASSLCPDAAAGGDYVQQRVAGLAQR